jgi:hypothetical protein
MNNTIRTVSCLIILLGLIHISFAFPLHADTGTLWFTGAGMAIVFAGLLNIVALDKGGSKFTKVMALSVNVFCCAGFCIALTILNQPQVYVGIIIFLITTAGFAASVITSYT